MGDNKEDKSEFIVYDDEPCLGQKAPSLSDLEFHNGGPVEIGKGKVTVVTFFSKLNKSDFPTLTVLSEYAEKHKDTTEFLGISRDGEPSDVSRFCEKYNDQFMAEVQAPNGEPGVTIKVRFPLAFDKDSKTNAEFKKIAKKAVIGVGFTFIIDREGVIRWYEKFVRGVNPMGQFEQQLQNIIDKKPLISNGNMPELEEEELDDGGKVPINADPFAGGDGY